jgi:hypothetical protein
LTKVCHSQSLDCFSHLLGKTISNTNEIELQFKVEELTSSAKLLESKLAAKEIQLKESQDKCKKLERYLISNTVVCADAVELLLMPRKLNLSKRSFWTW